jgi:hypothetical protein
MTDQEHEATVSQHSDGSTGRPMETGCVTPRRNGDIVGVGYEPELENIVPTEEVDRKGRSAKQLVTLSGA